MNLMILVNKLICFVYNCNGEFARRTKQTPQIVRNFFYLNKGFLNPTSLLFFSFILYILLTGKSSPVTLVPTSECQAFLSWRELRCFARQEVPWATFRRKSEFTSRADPVPVCWGSYICISLFHYTYKTLKDGNFCSFKELLHASISIKSHQILTNPI
ncbi:hypothetical protein BpHYR1_010057 [Brachionus plicatilis]|uniref:Uncharacterized protein n=1 Tax=Brachionus plicatilis TaxID=10195 RepID=A0A3M7QQV8_BRAPC|nr:hypothetical protein BpHYR1_010057 [Brachionus plicatilis]